MGLFRRVKCGFLCSTGLKCFSSPKACDVSFQFCHKFVELLDPSPQPRGTDQIPPKIFKNILKAFTISYLVVRCKNKSMTCRPSKKLSGGCCPDSTSWGSNVVKSHFTHSWLRKQAFLLNINRKISKSRGYCSRST